MNRFAWLGTDKAPLYVSFFFAALAWTLVRTADRIAATPIVEYRVDPDSSTFATEGHPRLLGIRFRNMTFARPTNCLVMLLNVSSHQVVGQMPLLLTETMQNSYRMHGNIFALGAATIHDQHNAELKLEIFPPGADVEFGLVTSGQGKVSMKARNCGPGAVDKTDHRSDAMPVVLERSIKTRLIEHELHALWVGLGLWALALFGLATARAKRTMNGER